MCLTYCPSLYVVGEHATDVELNLMQRLRRNMICKDFTSTFRVSWNFSHYATLGDTGLVVVGGADRNLYVSPTVLATERVSQRCVDRTVLVRLSSSQQRTTSLRLGPRGGLHAQGDARERNGRAGAAEAPQAGHDAQRLRGGPEHAQGEEHRRWWRRICRDWRTANAAEAEEDQRRSTAGAADASAATAGHDAHGECANAQRYLPHTAASRSVVAAADRSVGLDGFAQLAVLGTDRTRRHVAWWSARRFLDIVRHPAAHTASAEPTAAATNRGDSRRRRCSRIALV